MRISVLQHAPDKHLPARPGDPTPTSRNLDPLMHPFARARERTRALNAVKMERMFAKPFVASLDGHVDAVEVLARRPGSATDLASGSWDGDIILHNLAQRSQILKYPRAHKGKVAGLCFSQEGGILSCGVDRNVKLWSTSGGSTETACTADLFSCQAIERFLQPVNIYPAKSAFNSIDHRRTDPLFATASSLVQIWDETRTAPVSDLTFPTSHESVTSVRFNLSESSVLASIGSDRTFTLYDIRTGKAERRVVMQMRSNDLAWSPTFPTTILLASEDHNLYTFDIRHLDTPTQIYKAHVAAVMSCDWSPTGTEFVSGGWDRTVRIWKEGQGHSPEVYHTKRMQRVTSSIYSADARFVLSGSDDGNIRIWKAKASEKLGVITARERAAMEYRDSLKERWKMDKEVGRIARTRHLPTPVFKAAKLKTTMLEASRVKEGRRRKHTRAGESKPKAERKKFVIAEQA
ncbi:WD40 repeat-like protein [Fistulina hepatica ATCC 64428]|uniref:WD40 repeat-like protein n=1 Tax=Fistulina hepatica ATCC 64428 TaxID=1128425 RepID=A0A0D7AFS7_9AGAR|nr:WD40 repeat-like protein [Fistulina hepatica ATCC 64428]